MRSFDHHLFTMFSSDVCRQLVDCHVPEERYCYGNDPKLDEQQLVVHRQEDQHLLNGRNRKADVNGRTNDREHEDGQNLTVDG